MVKKKMCLQRKKKSNTATHFNTTISSIWRYSKNTLSPTQNHFKIWACLKADVIWLLQYDQLNCTKHQSDFLADEHGDCPLPLVNYKLNSIFMYPSASILEFLTLSVKKCWCKSWHHTRQYKKHIQSRWLVYMWWLSLLKGFHSLPNDFMALEKNIN